MGMPITHDDLEYIEHRVYHDYVGSIEHDMKDPVVQADAQMRGSQPYE